jgi:hypothetical protein
LAWPVSIKPHGIFLASPERDVQQPGRNSLLHAAQLLLPWTASCDNCFGGLASRIEYPMFADVRWVAMIIFWPI